MANEQTSQVPPNTADQKSDRKKRLWKRAVIAGLAGIVVGLGASWLSGQLGSSCTLMCNPYVAASLGGALGASMGVAE
ncbi:hypothetical protein GF377_05020 [candidate division GN15 bacterium]|nr:hypothetical protein [candidate division GN15 bacterium]